MAGHAFITQRRPSQPLALNDADAVRAIRTFAGYLAQGCASVIRLLDPAALIISGGLAQDNPTLLEALEKELATVLPAWNEREFTITASQLGMMAA